MRRIGLRQRRCGAERQHRNNGRERACPHAIPPCPGAARRVVWREAYGNRRGEATPFTVLVLRRLSEAKASRRTAPATACVLGHPSEVSRNFRTLILG